MMTLKQIQDLIKYVADSGVHEVEIEKEGFKLRIQSRDGSSAVQQSDKNASSGSREIIHELISAAETAHKEAHPVEKDQAVTAENNYITVKSPMIGTFYRSASPEKPPFINVGSTIMKGDIICIIEAMKLFNEIESEVSGKVVKILVDNANPVEYDQPLILVEPV